MSNYYTDLAQEIVVALRRDLSQEQVNRKIKAKTNQVARWESGHSKVEWIDFCQLCKAMNISLKDVFFKTLFYEGDVLHIQNLLHFLSHFSSYQDLSRKMNLSASKISRVMNNKTPLTLDFILHLVDIGHGSMVDFASALTQPQALKSLEQRKALLKAERDLHYQRPWIAAMILFLIVYEDSKDQTDLITFLSQKINQPQEKIKEAIQQLLELNLIQKTPRGYHPVHEHLSTSDSFEGAVAIRKYWNEKCHNYLEKAQPGQNHFFGYKVFNINKKNLKTFQDFCFKTHEELNQMIKQQEGDRFDEVALFSFQFINLDEERLK